MKCNELNKLRKIASTIPKFFEKGPKGDDILGALQEKITEDIFDSLGDIYASNLDTDDIRKIIFEDSYCNRRQQKDVLLSVRRALWRKYYKLQEMCDF